MENHFRLKYEDKSSWAEFKEDLKTHFRNELLNIRFKYSEKTPKFHIIYQSKELKFTITWLEEGLDLLCESQENLSAEIKEPLSEIYDMLELFGGKLESGNRPEEWL